MIFFNQIINAKGTPSIYEDTLANRPAASSLGRLFVQTDNPYGIYRDQGTSWQLITGNGGGGSQNWDQVLAQGGSLTAERIVDIGGQVLNFNNTGAFKIINSGSVHSLEIANNTIYYYNADIEDYNWLYLNCSGRVLLGDFYYQTHGVSLWIENGTGGNVRKIFTKGEGYYSGLEIDYDNFVFTLGDYGNNNNGTRLYINDNGNGNIKTLGGDYNLGAYGMDLDLSGNLNLGDYARVTYGGMINVNSNGHIRTYYGSSNEYGFDIYCDETTSSFIRIGDVNNEYGSPLINMDYANFVLNYYGGDIGIKFNFLTGVFNYGNWGANIYSLSLVFANNTIYTSNYYATYGTFVDYTNKKTYLGDYDNNLGIANLKLDYTIFTLNNTTRINLNGTGITSNTSGGTSSTHLIVFINGTQYKIQLRNP